MVKANQNKTNPVKSFKVATNCCTFLWTLKEICLLKGCCLVVAKLRLYMIPIFGYPNALFTPGNLAMKIQMSSEKQLLSDPMAIHTSQLFPKYWISVFGN